MGQCDYWWAKGDNILPLLLSYQSLTYGFFSINFVTNTTNELKIYTEACKVKSNDFSFWNIGLKHAFMLICSTMYFVVTQIKKF